MIWKPIRTVPDKYIGGAILVWVPKNRCTFAVCPYGAHGTKLMWWGCSDEKFPHKATLWTPMPKPAKKQIMRKQRRSVR